MVCICRTATRAVELGPAIGAIGARIDIAIAELALGLGVGHAVPNVAQLELVVAHKLLNSFYDAVFLARSRVGSRGAPVARLGAKRTYPICPILRRRYLASLSVSRNVRGRILYACGKGWRKRTF